MSHCQKEWLLEFQDDFSLNCGILTIILTIICSILD